MLIFYQTQSRLAKGHVHCNLMKVKQQKTYTDRRQKIYHSSTLTDPPSIVGAMLGYSDFKCNITSWGSLIISSFSNRRLVRL